jgi:hypothetical protein
LGLLLGVLAASQPGAAGPPGADRAPRKEPAYKARPTYGLLLLGRKAETRVWVVRDHDTLYVDRNADGDLTERGEAFLPAREDGGLTYRVDRLCVPGAPRQHTNLEVTVQLPSKKRRRRESWTIRLDVEGRYQQWGTLAPAETPGRAPVLHFGGPLRFASLTGPKLLRGEPGEVAVMLEPSGAGHAQAAVNVESIPRGVHPVADVTFPGARAESLRVRLTKRC